MLPAVAFPLFDFRSPRLPFPRALAIRYGTPMDPALILFRQARSVLEQLPPNTARPFLEDWPVPQVTRCPKAAALPVLDWLAQAGAAAPPGPLATLARTAVNSARTRAWRQTYRCGEVDAHFLERYGWFEVFGLTGPIASEALACGLLLLGPEILYPSHDHSAEELYVPLSGTAEWQAGGAPFALRAPGEPILHRGGEAHAMRTLESPLLALYVWRGSGLAAKARLVPATRIAPPRDSG